MKDERENALPSNTNESAIVLKVTVMRCGHSARVKGWEIAEGPPHVKRFIDRASLHAAVEDLARKGYSFRVETVCEDVSLLEWMGGVL